MSITDFLDAFIHILERRGFVQYLRRKMVKLFCRCLNICINTQGSKLKKLNGESFITGNTTDDFFKGEIYEVQLAVGGIKKVIVIIEDFMNI